jgi:Bacterial regulatory proteins, gntR family
MNRSASGGELPAVHEDHWGSAYNMTGNQRSLRRPLPEPVPADQGAHLLAVFQQSGSRKVERGLHGLTTAALARRVLAGELQPGGTVDPELLGTEFGVRATVVREALRTLGAKGMIASRTPVAVGTTRSRSIGSCSTPLPTWTPMRRWPLPRKFWP